MKPATPRGMGLNDAEIDLVRRRDWKAMIEAGGSIYLLIKIAGALGVPLYEVGAQTAGMTLEQFMAQAEGTLSDGTHRRWCRLVACAVVRAGVRQGPAEGADVGAAVRRLRAGARLARGAAARPVHHRLQRPREPVLLQRLPDVRAGRGRCVSAGGRRLGQARPAGHARRPGVLLAPGAQPGRGRIRSDDLPGDVGRSRRDVVHADADRHSLAGADRAAGGERDPASGADGAAAVSSWARRCGARSRAIRRTSASW